MKIKRLEIRELKIPFELSFAHASKTREETESVLVTAVSESGKRGYGEGCPRSYVTGESIQTAFDFFHKNERELEEISDVEELIAWSENNQSEIDENPASWCAIELALLDVLGKEEEKRVESLLSLPQLSGSFRYTAVLGVSSEKAFQKLFLRYQKLGFTDYKMKLSGDLEEDQYKVDFFRRSKDPIRLRVDANNLFRDVGRAERYISTLHYPFLGIEEPLRSEAYAECKQLSNTLKIPVILDESFLRSEQFSFIRGTKEVFIINIRISKMGGVLRSLAVAREAKALGISVIIGAQVGETSILTRAALTVANSCREVLLAQEGACGTYLLKEDVTDEPLMFGGGGVLSAEDIPTGGGFGLVMRSSGI